MWSHQLVKVNYRCRIHSESFITSHCPPCSPTASSLFSHSVLRETRPINVIAGDCWTQSSATSQSLPWSMAVASMLPSWGERIIQKEKEKWRSARFYLIISGGRSTSCLWCRVFVSSSITGYDLTTLYNEPYIIILTGTGNRHPLLSRSVQRLRSLSQRNFLAFSRFGVNDPPHQSFYIWFHGALNGMLQSYILTMNRRKKHSDLSSMYWLVIVTNEMWWLSKTVGKMMPHPRKVF